MSQAPPASPILLQDYRPPAFLTPSIELDFVLEPEATLVTARQRFERNPQAEARASSCSMARTRSCWRSAWTACRSRPGATASRPTG